MNKLTSGTVRLELRPLDLEATLAAAIESMQPTAGAKGVELRSWIDGALPRIQADGRRVQQVLWNVLHNAVKFTRSGGRVDVRASLQPESVQIAVQDTGEGIAPEFLPYVFDRFRQADSSTTRSSWGLGLGLSIAKHLVELHGGSIAAASPGVNQGSTFVLHLPVLAAFEEGDVAERATSLLPVHRSDTASSSS